MAELDPQLAASLKAAKTRPHNFSFVVGSKDKLLFVSRSKVSPADIKAAKERASGSVVISGVCRTDGADGLVFETAARGGATLGKQLATSIKVHAGLRIAVSVAEKDAVAEIDDTREQSATTTPGSAKPAEKGAKPADSGAKPANGGAKPAGDGKATAGPGAAAAQPPAEVDPRLVSARAAYKDALAELTALLAPLKTDLPNEVAGFAAKIKAADPGLAKPAGTIDEKETLRQVQVYKASLAQLAALRAAADDQLSKARSGKSTDPTGAARARAGTLAKNVAEEVAAALRDADDEGRKSIQARREKIQQAVVKQQWEEAITAMEALRSWLREMKGTAPTQPGAVDPVLRRARETWRKDTMSRLEPVRADASMSDQRRLDALRKNVDGALEADDMRGAGTALEALDEAIPEVAEATRARRAHEAAVRERRARADRVLDRLEKSRDRAKSDEVRRVDGLRQAVSAAFKADELAGIDKAIDDLEAALAELDPTIAARDKVLDDRFAAAEATLALKKGLGFPLAVAPLEKLIAEGKDEQVKGNWDGADRKVASLETKVARLSADLIPAVLLEGRLNDAIDSYDPSPLPFDINRTRVEFNRLMAGALEGIAAGVAKLDADLTQQLRKEANKRNTGPAVPPAATNVTLDHSSGRPKLPGSGIFLSVEMRRNQAGERGAEHKVPLDVLDYAAKKSKGKAGSTDGGNPAYYFPVGPGKTCSKFLCIVIAGDTMITSYTITASDMARKMGLDDGQLHGWAERKAYTRAF